MRTIVWDVDDVLNELMRTWFERSWLATNPSCAVPYEGLLQNPPHTILGIDCEEYLASLDAFRLSDEYIRMPPSGSVLSWFRRSGHHFRHLALTATPLHSAPRSAAWVLQHFGNWIRSFAFVPSVRKNDPSFRYDQSKEDYLRWWSKADIIVDDSTDNIESSRKLGILALQVPRPWNKAEGTLEDLLQILDRAV